MRLDRIYTKIGDKGKTLLANGEKVQKWDDRIEAYGTVDELNSSMGLLRDHLGLLDHAQFQPLLERIRTIQNELFDIGGELATPSRSLDVAKQQVVSHESVERLEAEIDEINGELPPLKNFILPGGHPCVSLSHVVRCVCRRAERRVFRLASVDAVRPDICIYLNRLSDWLFVMGRHIAKCLAAPEVLWQQAGKK